MKMDVLHDETNHQFYLMLDGHRAYVEYEIIDDCIFDLQHTIVPKPIGGRGLAALLVENACNYARNRKLKIRATCAYAQVWLERHPGYEYEIGDCAPSCPL